MAKEFKAWKVENAGKPSDAEVSKLAARTLPALKPDQVLVKVRAAALNPIDYKLAEALVPVAGKPPMYLGGDFAGVVEEAGEQSGFSKGQEVWGDVLNKGAANPIGGSLSEYIVVPASQIAEKPKDLLPTDAAALPLTAQTVLDCIRSAEKQGPIKEGARVLILGASGGVGTAGVQICKARGAFVIGVCSGKNKDMVLGLGADEVIDYKEFDWSEKLKDCKVDVVFDFAPSGPDSATAWKKAKNVLKPGRIASFITISGPSETGEVGLGSMVALVSKMIWRNAFSGFKYRLVLLSPSADKLQELKRLVEDGKLKPVVEKVYAFADVPAAYAHLMSGRAVGKLCVQVS